MATQMLGKEGIDTLRSINPAYRLREVDQTAPAGMWQIDAQGGDLLFQASTDDTWTAFTTVVTMTSTPSITINGTITFSGTVVFSANVRLDDDIVVLFGDGSDYYMGYSATADLLEIGTGSTINTNAVLSITSSGYVGIGTAPSANQLFRIGGTHTNGSANGVGFGLFPAITTATGSSNYSIARFNASVTTYAASDTYTNISTLMLDEPSITLGSGSSVTTAATLTINDAPTEATNNYALFVDSGATRLDGTLTVGDDLDLSNNDLLNVGNASAEWTSTVFKAYGVSGTDVGSGPDIQAQIVDTTALAADNGAGLALGGQPQSGEYWQYAVLKAYKSTSTSDDVSAGLKIYTQNNKVMTERVDIDLNGKVTILGAVKLSGAGTPGAGKVLTSDADGDATWETP